MLFKNNAERLFKNPFILYWSTAKSAVLWQFVVDSKGAQPHAHVSILPKLPPIQTAT